MIAIVTGSKISGQIQVPASKSSMQRACAIALLRNGDTEILNPGISHDDKKALGIIEKVGARLTIGDSTILIASNGLNPVDLSIDCGESGLSFRMFSIISALADEAISIQASGSLVRRPVDPLLDIFAQTQVQVLSPKGEFPLLIQGPMQVKNLNIDGSKSSQYLTGLLIALAMTTKERVSLSVMNLSSKPYVDLTLNILQHFGYKIENQDYKEFIINPANTSNQKISYHVESDWSSASFLLVAAAIAGSLRVTGLDILSKQADRQILLVLKNAGANVDSSESSVTVSSNTLQGFYFDATNCPDLFPPLAALAAYSNGISKIRGTNRLVDKESNRAYSIAREFGKMNVPISIEDDVMIIHGGGKVIAANVDSHNDHRIAMALSVLALRAEGNTEISSAESVSKSYPDFFADIRSIGANVSLKHILKV